MTEKIRKCSPLVVVLSTVGDANDARSLAASMLDNRLAACVQIDSPVQSHYRWEGENHVDTEYRLVIKTVASGAEKLVSWLSENHPYDEPQIVVIPVVETTPGYARWVVEQTGESSGIQRT